MRPIKTLLFFACKAGVLLVGFIFSLFLAAALGFALAADQYGVSTVGFFAGFVAGLFLTAGALLLLRRKTWSEVEYDKSAWVRRQTERKSHPVRTRYKRIATRILVWVPSAIAALVLFFFPVATHFVHPGSRYLEHYRFRIPWTYTVFPSDGWGWDLASIIRLAGAAYYDGFDVVISSSGRGRFGVTPFLVPPFWNRQQPISDVTFGSVPNAAVLQTEWFKERYGTATEIRGFRLGGIELTCWQYRSPYRSENWPYNALVWHVYCATPVSAGPHSFDATFDGRDEDLGSFYQIIEGVTPIP
jgi:hypothetical protein